MSSSTVIWPREHRDHSIDADGNLTFFKRQDEVQKLTLDWSDTPPIRVNNSSISSVAYEDHGVTRTSTSSTATTTITHVTGSGYFEITVTFANTEKLQRIIRFVATDGSPLSDYR